MANWYIKPDTTNLGASDAFNDAITLDGTDGGVGDMANGDNQYWLQGTQKITAGFDALKAIQFEKWTVGPSCGIYADTPFDMQVNNSGTALFSYSGIADLFKVTGTQNTSSEDGSHRQIDIWSPNTRVQLVANVGDCDRINHVFGTLDVLGDFDIDEIFQAGGEQTVEAHTSGALLNFHKMSGGTAIIKRRSTVSELVGNCTMRLAENGICDKFILKPGATFLHESTDATMGGPHEWWGGTFDPSGALVDVVTLSSLLVFKPKDDPGQFFTRSGNVEVSIPSIQNHTGAEFSTAA